MCKLPPGDRPRSGGVSTLTGAGAKVVPEAGGGVDCVGCGADAARVRPIAVVAREAALGRPVLREVGGVGAEAGVLPPNSPDVGGAGTDVGTLLNSPAVGVVFGVDAVAPLPNRPEAGAVFGAEAGVLPNSPDVVAAFGANTGAVLPNRPEVVAAFGAEAGAALPDNPVTAVVGAEVEPNPAHVEGAEGVNPPLNSPDIGAVDCCL